MQDLKKLFLFLWSAILKLLEKTFYIVKNLLR